MESAVSLLIQVPLVGVFIWFSLRMVEKMEHQEERFLDSLNKRDEASQKRDEAYLLALDEIGDKVDRLMGQQQGQKTIEG